MDKFTPTQQKMVETWSEKRDSLLRELGVLETQVQENKTALTQGGLNLDALNQSIAEVRGRLAELDALEERKRNSLANDIVELEIRKSRLEGEVVAEEIKFREAAEAHGLMTLATNQLSKAHKIMKDQSAIMNRVVGEIIQTSTLHASEMKTIMSNIRTLSVEVIEKGNENVEQTNLVLEKLPRYIFELQKPIPLRRAYRLERGVRIENKPEIEE